eukprot:XP_011683080.1 PREDICTED: uncharacterized protein LOC105447110 [Strongylocentrotus purpuratus]
MNMRGISLHWFIFLQVTLIGELTCANILDVTCINFNPIYDTSSSASYAAILNGADVTSMVSFQRSVDLDTGDRQSTWCSLGDDEGACGLPQGSTIDVSGRVTFQNTDQDKFGVYGCRAERYNWTTETSTIFIRNDGCPSSKYGLDCSQNCPVCYAGGVCHDVTGECVCRSGFTGVNCETDMLTRRRHCGVGKPNPLEVAAQYTEKEKDPPHFIVKLFENKGRGIVAQRDISKGEFLLEYPGQLISAQEGNQQDKFKGKKKKERHKSTNRKEGL